MFPQLTVESAAALASHSIGYGSRKHLTTVLLRVLLVGLRRFEESVDTKLE